MPNTSNSQLPILSYIITNNGQGTDRIKRCLDSVLSQDYPSKIPIIVNFKDNGDKDELLKILSDVEQDKPAPLSKTNEIYKGKYQSANLAIISFNDYLSVTEARSFGIGAVYGYTHIFGFLETNEYYMDAGLSSLAVSKFILNPNIIGLIYSDRILERFGVEEHSLNELHSSYFISKTCLENCNKQLPELSNNYNLGPMLKSHLALIGLKSEPKVRQVYRACQTATTN